MTTSEPVDSCLRTRIGRHDHDAKPMTVKVCGTFQEAIKSHWDSCASACFESSLEHCVPNSFVKLEKKIVTADGGCNSDGMAWRRYHVPVTEEWITLGDEYGFDLRQADVITFAMPPIIATKFPTPVSIIAAPVAKGLFISTLIEGGSTKQTRSSYIANLISRIPFITKRTAFHTSLSSMISWSVSVAFV